MPSLEQVLWYIAIPASVVFALQTLLMVMGVITDHSDADIHHDGMADHAYFPIFTIRNLIVLLMMFGWTGIALVRQFQLPQTGWTGSGQAMISPSSCFLFSNPDSPD
jgi:hypothetical protein